MQRVISVNAFRCRMWDLHDRLDDHITEANCRSEIESFSRHGQLIPVLGRPLREHPKFDVELIYGARRLFVARHLNIPLTVELRELSDREALIAMDIENRVRKDISPYERALSYSQWLRSGHFRSQEDIARALKISPSKVCRLLKLAQLPAVIIKAFANPLEICEGWGMKLATLLEDPRKRHAVLLKARAIIAESAHYPAREVYRQLLAAASHGRKVKAHAHDDLVRAENGATLFRVRQQRDSIAVLLPLENMPARTLKEICNAISGILQAATPQVLDSGCSDSSKHIEEQSAAAES